MSHDNLTAADTPVGSLAGEPARRPRALAVVYTGDGDDASTRVIELPDGARLTIGRARDATIVVDSERVSRIHARLSRRGDSISVEDAGSRNRTWVNGVAIEEPRVLASGDEIVIGPATIVVSTTTGVVARPRIASSQRLEEQLATEVDRGKRYRRVFSLLMFRLTGDVAEIDPAIDRIAGRLRAMDLLAEYAPLEPAVVLPELDATSVGELALALIEAARTADDGRPAPITVAAGVAAFPAHGTTAGELIARARAAAAVGRRGVIGVPPDDPSPAPIEAVVDDPQMRRVFELVRKVADHPISVLIYGETGVGKEVVVAAIHKASSRRSGPLVRLNCASVPESLLESALFGHEKGAFTGAERRKQGYFEAAHRGTLFLDEIGELSLAMQAKLLRVLEERTFTRVGGTEEITADVRVVCATNRDLETESHRGTFRSDLFFRISAFTILVPPLRDRPGDIIPLAEHFIRQVSGPGGGPVLAPAAIAAIRAYAWPGNVRELRNALERAVVVHAGHVIELHDLPDRVRDHALANEDVGTGAAREIRGRFVELERDAIISALEVCAGNQTEAAKQLGISRRTLIYRMEKHGLKPPPASRG